MTKEEIKQKLINSGALEVGNKKLVDFLTDKGLKIQDEAFEKFKSDGTLDILKERASKLIDSVVKIVLFDQITMLKEFPELIKDEFKNETYGKDKDGSLKTSKRAEDKEITLEFIDYIMREVWDDDEGEFAINEHLRGSYKLIDVTRKGDENDKYIFEIRVTHLGNGKTEKYKYIINNLGGENELSKL